MKAKFSITGKKLQAFGKQKPGKHFLFILADEENVVGVMFSLPFFFFLRKKKCSFQFALKGKRIKENRGNGGKVLLFGKWPPRTRRAGSVIKCSCTQSPLLKRSKEGPILSCGFQRAVRERNNQLHHYLISMGHGHRTSLAALRAVMPKPKLSKVNRYI